jgi:hypothetical protein
VPEVDCCLTTGELQQLLEARGLGKLADVQVPSGHLMSADRQQIMSADRQQTMSADHQQTMPADHQGSMDQQGQGQEGVVLLQQGQEQGAQQMDVDGQGSPGLVPSGIEGHQLQQQLQQQHQSTRHQLPLVLTLEALLQQQAGQQGQGGGVSGADRLYGLPGGSGGYMEFVFRWGTRKFKVQVQYAVHLHLPCV